MPIDRSSSKEPFTKREFHERLLRWFVDTDEDMIGDPAADGRTAWLYVRDADSLFKLHADTPRRAVEEYLRLLRAFEGKLEWSVRPSRQGKMTAVAFGPDRVKIEPFYLYVHRLGANGTER